MLSPAGAGQVLEPEMTGPERDAVLRLSLSRLSTESDVKVAALALREAVDEIASVVELRRRDSKP